MKLIDYLKQQNISYSDFAKQINVTASYITYILQNKRRPSPEIALKIEQVTEGRVSRIEVLYPGE